MFSPSDLLMSCIVNSLNFLLPKLKDKIVFIGYPDYDDMLRGLILQSDLSKKNFHVLIKDESIIRPNWLNDRCKIVRKNSIKGLFHLVTSKRVYFTHGILNGFKLLNENRQLVINLWHGMPLKRIGYMDNKSDFPAFHYTLATSDFFSDIIQRSFKVNIEKVLISDLPRNIVLKRRIPSKKLERIISGNKNIIVWLPTYRVSNVGDIRKDSSSTSLLGIDNLDLDKLNRELSGANIELFIKPHPMAKFDDIKIDEFDNIDIIDEHWLAESDLTLYQLLSYSAALITDYSSVYVDYLSLNKPIIFVMTDEDEYKDHRGFSFDVKSEGLPGVVITNGHNFGAHLIDSISKPLCKHPCTSKYYDCNVVNDLIQIK